MPTALPIPIPTHSPAPTPTRPSPLPAVLRLPPHRSVLRLGPDARLLGLDPAVALAVEDLPPPLAEMLDELTGPVQRSELVGRAIARGADSAAAEGLLAELVDAGAVVDAAVAERRVRRRAGSAVVVEGAGPLAVGIVLGLVQAGIGAVHIATAGSVLTRDLGTGYVDADRGHDRHTATRRAVRRLRPAADAVAPPQRLVPDLVVLTDALGPDPVRIAQLHAAGTAHLTVRLRDGVGVVGPLVLPGRSACLGCLELQRRARDPGWPTVAAQLAGRSGEADPAATAATAALAAAQALAALDATAGGAARPPTLEATVELDATAATVVRRAWTAQPGCGCGAAAGAGPGTQRPVGCATRPRRARITAEGRQSGGD